MKLANRKKLLNNIGWSVVFKIVSMFASIAQIPFYLIYFDENSDLAFWFVILSVFNIIIYIDFGISSGIKNHLTYHIQNNDFISFNKTVGNAVFSSFATGLVLTGILFSLISIRPDLILSFFEHTELKDYEIIHAFSALIAAAGITFILRIVVPILHALQRTAISTLLPLCTQFAMLSYLFFGINFIHSEKIVDLAFAYCIFAVGPYIIVVVCLLFVHIKMGYSFNGMKNINLGDIKLTLLSGFKFFTIQLCVIFLINSNELIIYRLVGDEQVINYQVHYRFYSIFIVGFSTISIPLWSAISLAHISGEKSDINNLFRIACKVLFVFALIIAISSVFFQKLSSMVFDINLISEPLLPTYLFGLFSFIYCGISVTTAFLNGMNQINYQVLLFIIAVIFKLIYVLLLLSDSADFSGVLLSTIIPLLFLLVFFIIKILSIARPILSGQ